MTRAIILVTALIVGGSAVLAAPQNRPGDINPGHLYIDNRRPDEAIPVAIVTNGAQPVPVALTSPIALQANTAVTARMARQAWEYTTVAIRGQDPAATLAASGRDGWEAVTVLPQTGGFTLVLLKRPGAPNAAP
jgi:hypothetical protein